MYKKVTLLFVFIFYSMLIALIKESRVNNTDIHIVFDLGGVLVETDSSAAFKELIYHVGPINFSIIILIKLLTLKNPFALDSMIFNYLSATYPRSQYESLACDIKGNLLPQPMCDWLKGKTVSTAILANVLHYLDNSSLTSRDIALLKAISHVIFEPATFVRTRKLISAGVSFAKRCKQQGYKIYILSNWDCESFALLRERNAEFFDLFDGIIISGQAQMLKPDANIFNYAFNETWHLNLERTVYLDDQPENLTAPKNLGVQTILCTSKYSGGKPDFKKVTKKFKSFLQTVDYVSAII